MNILALEFTTNLFGKLSTENKDRIRKLIECPTQETWEDACHMIIKSEKRFMSIWQAVRKVDPSFQSSRNSMHQWETIPTSETIIKAINLIVFSKSSQEASN